MSYAKRCFISHLHTENIVANSRESLVRIIGVVISIESARQEPTASFPGKHGKEKGDLFLITLDDGTAVINIWTPSSMVQALSLSAGVSVDCMARLRQNSSIRRWYTETLILVTQPDIENLRWLELSNPPKSKNDSRRFGYPTLKINADEAYRIITLQSHLSKEGVSMEDLASVMQKSESEMKEMIQELQVNGQVYQNEGGKYVPL
jgi:hypothetical protein